MTWGGGVRTALQHSAVARGNSTASWTWSVRSENWWVDCLPEALPRHLSQGIIFTSPTTWANQRKWCDVALKWVYNCIEQLYSISTFTPSEWTLVATLSVWAVKLWLVGLLLGLDSACFPENMFSEHILAFYVHIMWYCLLPAGYHTVFLFQNQPPFSQFSLVM